jgi:hypothetical protein
MQEKIFASNSSLQAAFKSLCFVTILVAKGLVVTNMEATWDNISAAIDCHKLITG